MNPKSATLVVLKHQSAPKNGRILEASYMSAPVIEVFLSIDQHSVTGFEGKICTNYSAN